MINFTDCSDITFLSSVKQTFNVSNESDNSLDGHIVYKTHEYFLYIVVIFD